MTVKLNKLSLNIKKTNFIVFRRKMKRLTDIPNIQIDNVKVDMVETCKFLGIIINSSPYWSDHYKLYKSKS